MSGNAARTPLPSFALASLQEAMRTDPALTEITEPSVTIHLADARKRAIGARDALYAAQASATVDQRRQIRTQVAKLTIVIGHLAQLDGNWEAIE